MNVLDATVRSQSSDLAGAALPSTAPYPLVLERQLFRRIWGGQRIATWLQLPQPPNLQIGESWQVYDTNIVRNGPLARWTLTDVTQAYGIDLVGSRTIARYGVDFPLLVKFLDATSKNSIQVHPNDTYAHTYEAHTGFHGKNEAWHILHADPGATIISGLKRACSRAEFITAVANHQVEHLLHYQPVKTGDTVLVPAGTVHAFNGGILVYEVQEKSDLTYRVYDYGRVDAATGKVRELHLDKALDVIDFSAPPRSCDIAQPLTADRSRWLLTSCPYFALERWNVTKPIQWRVDPGSLEILTIIDQSGTLTWEQGHLPLRLGDSIVLPATLGDCQLAPDPQATSPLQVLRTYVPERG